MAQKPAGSGNRFDYEKAYAQAGELTKKKPAESSTKQRHQAQPSSAAKLAAYKKKKAARVRRNRLFLLIALLLIVIAVVVILLVTCHREQPEPEPEPEGIAKLELMPEKAQIDELYIYGTHLSMHGQLPQALTSDPDIFKIDMVLYNGEFIEIPLIISEGQFKLSDYTNGGLYLDDIPRGEYPLFVRGSTYVAPEPDTEEAESETEAQTKETARPRNGTEETTVRKIQKKKPDETTEPETSEDGEPVTGEDGEPVAQKEVYYRYYAVNNATDFPETVYYTMSSFANKIVIGNEHEYSTVQFTVKENTDQGVYDVVIDPGHGGYDAGAVGIDDYCERDFTLPLSLKIKELLEKQGMKVALTRDSDKDLLKPYGSDGRIARAMAAHAKFLVSIHMNSSGAGGLELFSANGIDYTFADILNDNIQKMTGIGDTQILGTAHGNVFSRNFTQEDVELTIQENIDEGLKPYEPSTRSSYYFIIRETGGIATGAYMDDRNPEAEYNPYCHTNVGIESYITELGYITVREDLEIMQKNMDGYARAISDSLMTQYGSAVEQDGAGSDENIESGSSQEEDTSSESGSEAEENESTTN